MYSIILHRLERVESSDDLIYTGLIQLTVKDILWSEELIGFTIADLRDYSDTENLDKGKISNINGHDFFTIIHYANDKEFIVAESIDKISSLINGFYK